MDNLLGTRPSRRRSPSMLAAAWLVLSAGAASGAVLRVGTFQGQPGDYTSIQDAVDAASPGDWILIAPGDYHERGDYTHASPNGNSIGGVTITKPNLHLRGLDRNAVIVDGTKPGAGACDASPDAQDLGPPDGNSVPSGRNGIEVFEVDGVTIENLTVCNFLTGSYGGGNQIWWNGGDGTGTVNLNGFHGAYLSATSTVFLGPDAPGAEYGIFASNVHGPGLIEHTYASNMRDASYYVGGCPDCNTRLTDAHAENSALGYSGTNSGGHLIIEKSEWDENTCGISANSQNNDDAPSPQDGACPDNRVGPTGSHSCTLFRKNNIHDNNNPNVPRAGSAALGPVGTGIVIAGGRNDTVIGNRIKNQGAWGVLIVPFPDLDLRPPAIAHCEGGRFDSPLSGICFYDTFGQEVTGNRFTNVGFFGNVTNGDLAELSYSHDPGNCWHGNRDASHKVSSAPDNIQQTHRKCSGEQAGEDPLSSDLSTQVLCATELLALCPDQPGQHYLRTTQVQLKPLPPQRTMPRPCKGVPSNPWC
ncbi:MAG: hypothetical protein E6J71_03690 [Deltaproteobacteria bacterium]|nr:MAG: hypothetical protein E6J71_03690 [Deltaproteobacteria bacterium]